MLSLPEHSVTSLDAIHHADALAWLRSAPSDWLNCVVTSPPYYGLRQYTDDDSREIGLEDTPEQYVERLVAVFREIRRVLRPDGVCWLNLGDSYAAKNLIGIPWRVAFALQDDGWILRSDVIWHKPNPMPESVTDRPTKAHEYVFLLVKSARYWYDSDAVREPHKHPNNARRVDKGSNFQNEAIMRHDPGIWHGRAGNHPSGRNKRTVWTVTTEPRPFRHFAMMPSKLAEIMILAGCPAQVCAVCGAPYERVVERERVKVSDSPRYSGVSMRNDADNARFAHVRTTIGWRATCSCAAETRPGIVYDPFVGSGTTALVAQRLDRHYIGTDINREYVELARTRLRYRGDDRRMLREQKG